MTYFQKLDEEQPNRTFCGRTNEGIDRPIDGIARDEGQKTERPSRTAEIGACLLPAGKKRSSISPFYSSRSLAKLMSHGGKSFNHDRAKLSLFRYFSVIRIIQLDLLLQEIN
ncbi:hypothetical protein SAY87_014425 [Trapa incisa]|uniref:Uncharacterized protein n=1 Tax=Trapa incisa TaxID=236973 RepID=A0AAN7GZY3_9MYRT|nr:hypothetical protein SAY87_014425 [Trapa incisa]